MGLREDLSFERSGTEVPYLYAGFLLLLLSLEVI